MAGIVVLFLQLSSWQWHRYHQKLVLQASHQAQLNAPAIPFEQALEQLRRAPTTPVFLSVRVRGRYDAQQQIVLDNRNQAAQAGYEILTPLLLNTHPGTILLVNRGFVPRHSYWHTLPDLQVDTRPVILEGYLSQPTASFALGPAIEANTQLWPLRAARLDLAVLQSYYSQSLLPYVLLLKPQQPGSYLCHWFLPPLSAERSLGYTFQWLVLAILTVVLWWVLYRRHRS